QGPLDRIPRERAIQDRGKQRDDRAESARLGGADGTRIQAPDDAEDDEGQRPGLQEQSPFLRAGDLHDGARGKRRWKAVRARGTSKCMSCSSSFRVCGWEEIVACRERTSARGERAAASVVDPWEGPEAARASRGRRKVLVMAVSSRPVTPVARRRAILAHRRGIAKARCGLRSKPAGVPALLFEGAIRRTRRKEKPPREAGVR